MKLRNKVAGAVLLLTVVIVVAGLCAIRYNAPCESADALPAGADSMTAAFHRCYGPPEVLSVEEVVKPVPGDDDVLVKVRAASLNAADWHNLRGEPYFIRAIATGLGRPNSPRLGIDFAGTVEAVGKNVTRFRPGDDVFGGRNGSLAEYVTVREDRAIEVKPAGMTFEQAAAVPVAALTALQALRDHGRARAGQKVLINGASGGVGTFAVQIAKALGAEVTGVCSTRNLAMVTDLGADHVVDYTREDFTLSGERYDLIVDVAGGHSPLEYRRVLKPDGAVVVVGTASRDPWVGAFAAMLAPIVYAPFVSQDLRFFIARLDKADLATLADLVQAGHVTPVIDRIYEWSEVRDAMRYLDEGHARGKVVVVFP